MSTTQSTFVIVADTGRNRCSISNPDLRLSQQEKMRVRVDRPAGNPSSVVVESASGAPIFRNPDGGASSRVVIDSEPWEREVHAGQSKGSYDLQVYMMVGNQRVTAGGAGAEAGGQVSSGTLSSGPMGESTGVMTSSLSDDSLASSEPTSERSASSPRMIIV